jgi:TolA-binding protein
MRSLSLLTLVTCFAVAPGFGANREMQELQRDVAQLQDQVRQLQSGMDVKLAALQTLVGQALDAANKANTGVTVVNAGIVQTLDRELRDRLAPVAAMGTKLDNTANDTNELKITVSDLNSNMNKLMRSLSDISTQIKLLQVSQTQVQPPAPDPTKAPPPPASALFGDAVRDQTSGKLDLAYDGFSKFLQFYPNDPNAIAAQFNIGEIHYQQNKLDQAVKDFDDVIEQYPEDTRTTPDAYYMKGMALKQAAKKADAATTFRALISKYPRSERSDQAKEQIRAMGLTVAPAASANKRAAPKR